MDDKPKKTSGLEGANQPVSIHQEWFKKYSNAQTFIKSNKLEIKFPKEGVIKPEKWKFSDRDELFTFISKRFSTLKEGQGYRGVIKRTGKYQRVDEKNNPIFTFGDPILDLITDERGVVTVGNKQFDLRAAELTQSDVREGGNSLIDFSSIAEELSKHQLLEAALGKGNFTIEAFNNTRIAVASSNQNTLWFYQPGTSRKMRFRAFKKNYLLYWKMGCDIETWGQNFKQASISSRYGEFLGSVCVTIKVDEDRDTNDDYVDEYEWGTFNTPKPDGISSNCVATWGDQVYSGAVSLGCTILE